ncbi:MAG: SURF1 family protein [Sphingosinicella sp.]
MKRIPILATLIVALAVATMIGLGTWQLRRATWKDGLIAHYREAAARPLLELDPLIAAGRPLPPISFRRVRVTCRLAGAVPELRGGRSQDGVGGYVYLVPCRRSLPLMIDTGWTRLPDQSLRFTQTGPVTGRAGLARAGIPVIVTSESAPPPLRPSLQPSLDAIPNNHRLYAFQWFAFAILALVIYALALRRRLRPPPPAPRPPGP